MNLLAHLNLYFGYEAPSVPAFIKEFKEEFKGSEDEAITSLLMFLNSVSKVL